MSGQRAPQVHITTHQPMTNTANTTNQQQPSNEQRRKLYPSVVQDILSASEVLPKEEREEYIKSETERLSQKVTNTYEVLS